MKIGILTQPLLANYGGLLQNYALQQVLLRDGNDVCTFDWGKQSRYQKIASDIKWRVIQSLVHSKDRVYVPTQKELSVIRKKTNAFIDKYINTTPVICSYSDFGRIAKKGEFDAFIVGSDQVWRPKYNEYLKAMYLGFVHDDKIKKIAYAASFGTDEWEYNLEESKLCASLAKLFNLITVREDTGIDLCKKHLGVDAIHVLDPTLLLKKEDYIHIVEIEKEPSSIGNLYNYMLDPSQRKQDVINRVAESCNLKPFKVLPEYCGVAITKEKVRNHIEDCSFPSVGSWLKAFMDAEMTIVDSFHGMVFSIIFNKPFWVIGNKSRGLSRFTSLLRKLHLESRLLDENNANSFDAQAPIDWDKVNSIIDAEREKSLLLLYSELKK